MSFFRSTLSALPKATRAYSTSAEMRVVGRLVSTEEKSFNEGQGQLFKYTIATENPSSMRTTDANGNSVFRPSSERTSSFFEIVGFNNTANYLKQTFTTVPNGSLLHITAAAELKKSSINGTVSERTGLPIQTLDLQLYHKHIDVLERFDSEVSAFRREKREARQAEQQA